MRVIAGQWKGRRLLSPVGSEVRPTTDRVKEALFNILGPRVSGAEVLDVCCGGGGLGIEALSRGARRAVFVDIAPQCLDLVRRNLKHCGAADAAWLTLRKDALDFLGALKREPPAGPWLLLADPPYASGLAELILLQTRLLAGCAGFVAAAVEHESRLDGSVFGGRATMTRRYGKSGLTIVLAAEGG